MSERLEEIKEGKEAMKEHFNRPDFELKTFNYDLVIDDLEYLIEQNKQHIKFYEDIRDLQMYINYTEKELYMEMLKIVDDFTAVLCKDIKF